MRRTPFPWGTLDVVLFTVPPVFPYYGHPGENGLEVVRGDGRQRRAHGGDRRRRLFIAVREQQLRLLAPHRLATLRKDAAKLLQVRPRLHAAAADGAKFLPLGVHHEHMRHAAAERQRLGDEPVVRSLLLSERITARAVKIDQHKILAGKLGKLRRVQHVGLQALAPAAPVAPRAEEEERLAALPRLGECLVPVDEPRLGRSRLPVGVVHAGSYRRRSGHSHDRKGDFQDLVHACHSFFLHGAKYTKNSRIALAVASA